ncbi:NADH-quinone oxidoreductase subunit C [Desulfopila sp. IMCC35006]|uniref:NADH-quinone oxidoreductase subunit C n=1 Tax=Desulfopila sp. IMCC35006 TaxID=2569542 RepID=UPI0010AD43D5|nr:NADH-quinone oxidoreductase subunit C [Desulfopila sp. IMCC35006]TKB23627.1 NADH-quinone oxidoreductase subunit C [Desulfopila sp. IMCC35006]
MICEKTRLALQKLFPTPEPQEAPIEDAGEEKDKKVPQEPRNNGLVERDYAVHGYHLDAQVSPDQLLEAVTIVDEAEFFIESITGVDWIKDGQLEVIYDFSRYDFDLCRVVIRTRVDRNHPVVPTITGIYAGANWHERETHEFFGIKFTGHPHLVPLLLPEDADFHPLLKDFKA